MATHSSNLAWRIPRTEEPGSDSPWGRKEWDMTEWLTLSLSGFKWCHYCWASLSWSTSWVGSGCTQHQAYSLPRSEVYTEAPRTHEKMLNIISLVGKCKSKPWIPFHIHSVGHTFFFLSQEVSADENMEKLEPLWVACRNVKWYHSSGKEFISSLTS